MGFPRKWAVLILLLQKAWPSGDVGLNPSPASLSVGTWVGARFRNYSASSTLSFYICKMGTKLPTSRICSTNEIK